MLIDCETVTSKSPLLLGADAPHVHPRLRKHLARCTLDCGFQTPESPALRGFEVERGPITGTSLYLVLKSNGLHHSKNLPEKFSFSPKPVPTNIAKKLPPQRCSKLLLIAFSASLTNGPCSLSRAKAGTHSASLKESHTAARTPKQGAFPPPATVRLCAASEIFYSATLLYTYISRFSVNPHHRQKRKSRRRCHRNSVLNRFSSRFLTSPTNGPRSLSQTKMGTHSALGERSHTRAYTPKQGAFRMGRYHYPRHELHVHEHPRAGCQNGKLCRFCALIRCAPEERREPSEQRCAYARRCSEASRPRWAAQTDTAR